MTLVYYFQTVAWIKVSLGTEVGHSIRWGSSSPERGTAPTARRVYCGQATEWTKMRRGTEACLGPVHIVLLGYPAPPRKDAQQPPTPLFSPCLLWPNGWMD